jgi:pSer/pThr/pTyr-binding forkhead associated (FHA) protein
MMNGQLLCRVRVGVTLTFKLKEESVLGCDKALAVVVPVEGVSRKHAKIVFDKGSYWIEDLKSTNGTFLNGQAVTRNRLRHLDVITLGKQADLVFVVRAAEADPPRKVMAIVRAALVPAEAEAAPYEIAPGEITIGRAPSNNLVVDEGAVSKVHARIERTKDQLVLEDLGSANGTFVNGARLNEAFLKDGDAVSLGGVETYKVVIEMGEVTSVSGRHAAVSAVPGASGASAPAKSRFSAEWKTRFDWSADEREELAELRRRLDEHDRDKKALRDAPDKADKAKKPAAKPAVPAPAPPVAKPAPPAPPAAAAAAPAVKPAAPSAPAPSAPVAPPARPAVPAQPPAPAKPATAPPLPAPPAAAPAPAVPKAPPVPPTPPIAPPPVAAVPVKVAPPAVPPAPAPKPAVAPVQPVRTAGPIATVRLTGVGTSLSVTQPGAYGIGRSREVELRVDHPTVSRKHARLILSDDRATVYLQDQGGANGTRHNGKEVAKLAQLADGDTIGIGEVDLKVSLERG